MKRCIFPLSALLLAACGSSGALYLPDQGPKHDNPLKKDARKTQPQASPDQTSQPPAATPDQTTPPPQP